MIASALCHIALKSAKAGPAVGVKSDETDCCQAAGPGSHP